QSASSAASSQVSDLSRGFMPAMVTPRASDCHGEKRTHFKV
ncbi:unnamed protein product, partial [marine sediment metagenome]